MRAPAAANELAHPLPLAPALPHGHDVPVPSPAQNGVLGHGLHHPFRTMFEDVFEELPCHLKEQSEQAIRERRIKWPEWKEEDS